MNIIDRERLKIVLLKSSNSLTSDEIRFLSKFGSNSLEDLSTVLAHPQATRPGDRPLPSNQRSPRSGKSPVAQGSDWSDSLLNFVGGVIEYAAPVVGAVFGGPAGMSAASVAGSSIAGAISDDPVNIGDAVDSVGQLFDSGIPNNTTSFPVTNASANVANNPALANVAGLFT